MTEVTLLRSHACPAQPARHDIYGPAVTTIEFWDDQWWATNGEYATAIRFCPWCGIRVEELS